MESNEGKFATQKSADNFDLDAEVLFNSYDDAQWTENEQQNKDQQNDKNGNLQSDIRKEQPNQPSIEGEPQKSLAKNQSAFELVLSNIEQQFAAKQDPNE